MLTAESNYAGLHRVYERYKQYGLQVAAFPCNQVGGHSSGRVDCCSKGAGLQDKALQA